MFDGGLSLSPTAQRVVNPAMLPNPQGHCYNLLSQDDPNEQPMLA
jgi:hypothetical protein